MLGLVSMTGHGRAQQTSDALAIDVEVRSVNNR
ncbi:MAG: YicC/YloC family endoribonuclease, partial [Pirellula sp.]